ncbi:MAG TPA: hypothetical protein VK066_23325 [Chloroflexota bacterium]|nr:hypothetical protein [Chloroflexota bacterium]
MTLHRTMEPLCISQRVESCDGQYLGRVSEVWPDAGVGEAWGAIGAQPIAGADSADPTQFAFSEAMPGEGESYFRLETAGHDLFVPMSYVDAVRDQKVVLSLAAADVPAMQWDIRPDFLANHHVPDSGAPSHRA